MILVNMLVIHIKHNKVCNVLLVIMEHSTKGAYTLICLIKTHYLSGHIDH